MRPFNDTGMLALPINTVFVINTILFGMKRSWWLSVKHQAPRA